MNNENENLKWYEIPHPAERLVEIKFKDDDVQCVINANTEELSLIVKGETQSKINFIQEFGDISQPGSYMKLEKYLNNIATCIEAGMMTL